MIVIGAGAAGILAGIGAALSGAEVILLEKNGTIGRKLYITGKGRCNVTNACDRETFFEHICTNSKFMHSSFSAFNNYDLMEMLEEAGCKLEIQRGDRVFPRSEKSSDVIKAFVKELDRLGVKQKIRTEVKKLNVSDGVCYGIAQPRMDADAVIIATGGLSYPATGSTGDGLKWAEELGLEMVPCRPSLVPIEVKERYIRELQGLSLKNVKLSVYSGSTCLYSDQGEMLFTHFGISGPLVLSASTKIKDSLLKTELRAVIDFKPALTEKQLDMRIVRDFSKNSNRDFINSLGALLPGKLIPVMVGLSGIEERTVVNRITAVQRKKLVTLFKEFSFTLTGLRGYREAVVTSGGLSVKELNPKTMECKKIKHLYFAGEVIDVDALTGGFNLQLAFSTGYTAGRSAGEKEGERYANSN